MSIAIPFPPGRTGYHAAEPRRWKFTIRALCPPATIADNTMLVASFGAQAVLLFAAPYVPLAQPWSCIGGNTIAAAVGVVVRKYCGGTDPPMW